MEAEIIAYVEHEVGQLLDNDKSGHDMNHIRRVTNLARRFASKEGANVTETVLIALLHDVDDYKIFGERQGTRNASRILQEANVPAVMKERVIRALSTIGYSKRLKGICPDTLEASVVSDADMCDAMGANGILRLHVYAMNNGGTFFDKNKFPTLHEDAKSYMNARFSTGKICVCHIFDKILRLYDLMLTNSGQKEARKRELFLTHFLYQLFDEEDVPEWSQYLNEFMTSVRAFPSL